MITHERFGQLRLSDFLGTEKIDPLEDWEFEGRMWVGEANGFSEWLRLAEEPEILRSMAIDFETFPASAAELVLETLGLPLRKGMTPSELEALLHRPEQTLRFAADRTTLVYLTSGPEPYKVECTVLNQGGLVYLNVMVWSFPDFPDRSLG